MNVASMRLNYKQGVLPDPIGTIDPISLFQTWFQEAKEMVPEPNAMCLSTCDSNGFPDSRVVLLKAFDHNGFVFYTNYNSQKSLHLKNNPFASCLFYWNQRQVRISGKVLKTSTKESDEYFDSRPRKSQIGAWVSEFQSAELKKREILDEREKELEKHFEGKVVKRPEFWGGWRVIPSRIEFWQGRESRLHDRICFVEEEGGWKQTRLYP